VRFAEGRDPEQHAEGVAHREGVYDRCDVDAASGPRARARLFGERTAAGPSTNSNTRCSTGSGTCAGRGSSGARRRRHLSFGRRMRLRDLRGRGLRRPTSRHLCTRASRVYSRRSPILQLRPSDVHRERHVSRAALLEQGCMHRMTAGRDHVGAVGPAFAATRAGGLPSVGR
jgi:hypothetical protein